MTRFCGVVDGSTKQLRARVFHLPYHADVTAVYGSVGTKRKCELLGSLSRAASLVMDTGQIWHSAWHEVRHMAFSRIARRRYPRRVERRMALDAVARGRRLRAGLAL